MAQEVVLTYDGELATGGRMLLYEYGRSQYAFSRILTTVERYRRSKIILQRITPAQRVDLVVSVPRQGSFKLDVQVDTSADDAVGGTNFDTLFALVIDRLIPPGEEFGALSRSLAKIKLQEIQKASAPDVTFNGEKLILLEAVAEGEVYSDVIASDLLEWARGSQNRGIASAGITRTEIERASLIIASDRRRRALAQGSKGLISSSDLDKLAARIRPMFQELAVPLGKSSSRISIGSRSSPSRYFLVDERRIVAIVEKTLDEEEVEITVKIKNFDVESGHGSMRIVGEAGIKYFSIDPAVSATLRPAIVLSMNKSKVDLLCVKYTDANGIISSYQVREVLP